MGMAYAKTRLKEITEAYSAHLKAVDEIGKPQPLKSNLAAGGSPASGGSASNGAVAGVPGAEGVAGVNLPGASASSINAADDSMNLNGGNPFERYMQASRDTQAAKNQAAGAQAAAGQGGGQGASMQPAAQQVTNPRWIQIEKNMQSHNASEWRVAILESDILLYDMLSQMGYPGNSIGEILKNVDKKNFVTLDDAWKAHRIRNIIAHEGANYELSKDEADRTIRLYKRVFDEFYFV